MGTEGQFGKSHASGLNPEPLRHRSDVYRSRGFHAAQIGMRLELKHVASAPPIEAHSEQIYELVC
jgi:hypothetical protein